MIFFHFLLYALVGPNNNFEVAPFPSERLLVGSVIAFIFRAYSLISASLFRNAKRSQANCGDLSRTAPRSVVINLLDEHGDVELLDEQGGIEDARHHVGSTTMLADLPIDVEVYVIHLLIVLHLAFHAIADRSKHRQQLLTHLLQLLRWLLLRR